MSDLEGLLQSALSPVEPPQEFGDRLINTLGQITEVAAEELSDWELTAMRDPRNWVRPITAVAAGSAAGAALILIRTQRKHKASGNELSQALEHLLDEGRKAAQRGVDLALEQRQRLR